MFVFNVIPKSSPATPFLVVISTTPFPALDPYNAEALGPLSTDILSTSLGLTSVNPPLVILFSHILSPLLIPSWLIGTPSTTTSAWVFPVKELFPLRTILDAEPKDPVSVMFKPATLPVRELAILWFLIRN